MDFHDATGSFKNHRGQKVIARAEADSRLKSGDTVIEYTGGNTGTSLAWVDAAG